MEGLFVAWRTDKRGRWRFRGRMRPHNREAVCERDNNMKKREGKVTGSREGVARQAHGTLYP